MRGHQERSVFLLFRTDEAAGHVYMLDGAPSRAKQRSSTRLCIFSEQKWRRAFSSTDDTSQIQDYITIWISTGNCGLVEGPKDRHVLLVHMMKAASTTLSSMRRALNVTQYASFKTRKALLESIEHLNM